MLKVAITKSYDDFQLDIDFSVGKGITGLLGPSGCGKSVTLRNLAGLIKPDSGSIVLNNRQLFDSTTNVNVPAKDRHIGYVFQNYALFPHMTVEENVGYGLHLLSNQERVAKVMSMLAKVDLIKHAKHYPAELSGGQQQRVALARTLVTEPELLLLDEPFSALDSHVKHLLELELLRIIKNSFTGTVLLVTHNIEEAYRLCEQIVVIDKGRINQFGGREDVIYRPANLTVARLVGYKNFVSMQIHEFNEGFAYLLTEDDHRVKVLMAKEHCLSIGDKVTIGIRSDAIQFAPRRNNTTATNRLPCKIISSLDGIANVTFTVRTLGAELQVEVPKNSRLAKLLVANKEPWDIILPENKLVIITKFE